MARSKQTTTHSGTDGADKLAKIKKAGGAAAAAAAGVKKAKKKKAKEVVEESEEEEEEEVEVEEDDEYSSSGGATELTAARRAVKEAREKIIEAKRAKSAAKKDAKKKATAQRREEKKVLQAAVRAAARAARPPRINPKHAFSETGFGGEAYNAMPKATAVHVEDLLRSRGIACAAAADASTPQCSTLARKQFMFAAQRMFLLNMKQATHIADSRGCGTLQSRDVAALALLSNANYELEV
jgi:hypothetical protein